MEVNIIENKAKTTRQIATVSFAAMTMLSMAGCDNQAAKLNDLEDYGFADWGGTDHIGTVNEGYEVDPVIVSEAVSWLESTRKQLNVDELFPCR